MRQTSSEGPWNDYSKRRCPTTQIGGQRGCCLGWRGWRGWRGWPRAADRYFRRRRSSSPTRAFARHLNDVATQLGFRRQAVYHYFRSKDQIPYELIDRAGQAIATSAQSTLDADMPPANKIAEVVRNHVRQLLRNIDIVRIQFSELFKLHGERADGLRRDMSAYVRGIAKGEGGPEGGRHVLDVPSTTQVHV